MVGIKREIKDLIRDVLNGDTDRGRGAVAGQLFNALLRAVEVERRVREQEEMLEKISELEERISRAALEREHHGDGFGGGSRW